MYQLVDYGRVTRCSEHYLNCYYIYRKAIELTAVKFEVGDK